MKRGLLALLILNASLLTAAPEAIARTAPEAIARTAPTDACRAAPFRSVKASARQKKAGLSPVQTLAAANRNARQQPGKNGFVEARHVYAYAPGALYELYTSPSFISTILLEPGEVVNDVAAGDTSRWMVTQSNAETEQDGRTIILVKPQSTGLRTNIVLITDRRTYLIEASSKSGEAYSAQIAWCYGGGSAAGETTTSVIERLNFDYGIRKVKGRKPAWLPVRAFDDGQRTFIELPANASTTDMPPLFVITPEGAELVNYRVKANRYIVDRLFDTAELRLGTRAPIVVRIQRRSRPKSVAQP